MEKSALLLEANADLQLGNIDGERWLEIVARVTEADRACAFVWIPGRTETLRVFGNADASCFTPLLLRSLDTNRSLLDLAGILLLDESALPAALPAEARALIKSPRNLYALIDTDPAISILLLHREPEQPAWNDQNRNHFRMILPALRKGHTLHKRLKLYDSFLRIANDAINSFTAGVVAVAPDGDILRANSVAQLLFDRGEDFTDEGNRFRAQNALLNRQLYEKLEQVRRMPRNLLRSFIWNRSFGSDDGRCSFQLCMQAFPNEDWHPVSSPHDRHVVMTLQSSETRGLPTPELLRDYYGLTMAQSRLVCAMSEGRNTADAAQHLNISVNTARSHLRAIYAKLGISSNTELVALVSATLVKYVPQSGAGQTQLKQ